jgi:hypothetical protein
MQATLHKAKSTLMAIRDKVKLQSSMVALQARNRELKTKHDFLEAQNERLRREIDRMIGSAMNTHCKAVRDLAFQLDGYRINEQTYLVTISPSIAKVDFLLLPWETNIVLMARWALMKLLPPDAFAPLIARGKIVSSGKSYSSKMFVSAKDLAADVVKNAATFANGNDGAEDVIKKATEAVSTMNKKRKTKKK